MKRWSGRADSVAPLSANVHAVEKVRQRPWTATYEARSEVRSSGFEVPKTSNFGPRTLARPACLVRLSCGSVLPVQGWLQSE